MINQLTNMLPSTTVEIDNLVQKINNVDFELTFLCNLNCKHCYNPTHKRSAELSTEKVKSITEEIKAVGFKEIHFNGGEPLMRKDIYEIINHSINLGLKTVLETNAVLLKSPEKIKNLNNFYIRASIDGSENIHNSIRRNKDSGNAYILSLENLAKAKQQGINVQLTCSVNKINYYSIYDLAKDIKKYNLDDLRVRLSMPAGHAVEHWDELEMDADNLKQAYILCEKIEKDFPEIKFDYTSLQRGIPTFEPKFFIDPRGLVKPYPFIEYFTGNLNEDSVRKVLHRIPSCNLPEEREKKMIDYLRKICMLQDD